MSENNNYTILAGTIPNKKIPTVPFHPLVLSFCQQLSDELTHLPTKEENQDWIALGFWLRTRNLHKLKRFLTDIDTRLGRGLTFHITPSNMPTMFLYSFIISLLSGNNNIVRISSRLHSVVIPICTILRNILEKKEFAILHKTNVFLSYDHYTTITNWFSSMCDSRIIWGGDATIQEIRNSSLSPHAIDVTFPDRYSFAIFNSDYVLTCSDDDLSYWAHRFYIDTYKVDQNACSSPQLIYWLASSTNIFERAQNRWWKAIALEAQSYDLAPIKVSEKYTQAWLYAMTRPEITSIHHWENSLYVYSLSYIPDDITVLAGKFGQFFQYPIANISDITPYISQKIQTISLIGISPTILQHELIQKGCTGCDRIVSVGQAMTMHPIWDGKNLFTMLSRIIHKEV